MAQAQGKPGILALCIAGLALMPLTASSQEASRRELPAIPVDTAPTLDGEVRNDPVWQAVTPTGGFLQTKPDEGRPASQRTEVRVAYTEDAIYFGFVLYDDDPPTIVVSDSRRDAGLEDQDAVLFILDTYLDEQNGFLFGTNPTGMQYDGQLSKAGQGTGMMGGSIGGAGGGFNINWDGVWDVKTQMGDFGWSAEFRIPFKTIRFPGEDVQSWGANF